MLRCMFRFARPCLLAALVSLAPLASGAGPAAPPLTPAERGAIIDALRANCDPSSGEAIKFADAGLLEAVSEAAEAELAQRVRPSDVDRAWAYDPPRHDIAAELAAAREAGRLGAWLKSLSPSDPRYRALIAARCRYQAMAWSGGWRPLPAGLRLSLGEQRPDVKLLRQRLAAEGYLPRQATASVTFDESVQRALRSFQQRHGLAANGLVEQTKPAYPWDYFDKTAKEDPFRRWSPMLSIRNAKTPTLIIHSQKDYRLDVSEGFQLFTALQLLGVPSEMLYFPDEGHWVLKPQNSELWYKTVNDWCDRWTHSGKHETGKQSPPSGE